MEDDVIKHDKKERLTRGWHLDKRISVAHFFATFAFAIALSTTIYTVRNDIENRITDVEQSQSQHEALSKLEFAGVSARLQALQERDVAFKLEIIRRLERIEDGIDRHIENSVNHRANQ